MWWPVIALFASEPASACSCASQPLARSGVPGDGAEDFPTDGQIRVLFSGPWPDALLAQLSEEYRLRGPDGELVPVRTHVDGPLLTLIPRRSLAPDTRYVLERVFAYGDGRLLSDDQRWDDVTPRRKDAPPLPAEVVRVWYPELAFTTGGGPDRWKPAEPGISDASYFAAWGGCGPGEALSAQVRVSEAYRETDLLALEVDGAGLVWRSWHVPWPLALGDPPADGLVREASAGDTLCVPRKVHIDITKPVRVRAVAWTASGRVARSAWIEAEPREYRGKKPKAEPEHAAREAQAQQRLAPYGRAFVQPAPTEPTQAQAAAPASCPHGVASVGTTVFGEHRAVQRRSESLAPGAGWILVQEAGESFDEERTSTLSLVPLVGSAAGNAVPLGPANDIELVLEADGDVPAVVVGHAQPAGTRLFRPCACEEPVWDVVLDSGKAQVKAATGAGRILAGWPALEGDEKRWTWRLLDAATGEVLTSGAIDRRPERVFWDGDAFALVVAADGLAPRSVLRLGPDGTTEPEFDLPYAGHGLLVRAGDGWVTTWSAAGTTAVAWLDANGTVAAGPWTLGTGALPYATDLAASGEHALIVGGSYYGSHGAVVVVDRAGGVSPPFEPGDGRYAREIDVEASGDGFVASYGTLLVPGRGLTPAVDRLECRADAPIGPPVGLAP